MKPFGLFLFLLFAFPQRAQSPAIAPPHYRKVTTDELGCSDDYVWAQITSRDLGLDHNGLRKFISACIDKKTWAQLKAADAALPK